MHAQCQQCWLRCLNDSTFHPTLGNNGIVGDRQPTFLTRIQLHPTSEMSMLGDQTWCSNYPTFHPTPMLDKCWINVGRNVGSFKQALMPRLNAPARMKFLSRKLDTYSRGALIRGGRLFIQMFIQSCGKLE